MNLAFKKHKTSNKYWDFQAKAYISSELLKTIASLKDTAGLAKYILTIVDYNGKDISNSIVEP